MSKGCIYFYGFYTGWDSLALLDALIEGRLIWSAFFALMLIFMIFVSVRSLRDE